MSQIRDIVFDLGGVLVDWNPRHLLVGHMGLDRADAEAFLREVCTTEWHLGLDGGRPFAEASDALLRAHPGHARLIRAYVEDWRYMFAGQFAATVRELEQFVDAGYRVHALTNYPGEQIRFLYERFDFMRAFESVVVSGLLGFMKPDRRIYDYLLDVIGARTCLFVDDRPENVTAASLVGIEAIQFDHATGPVRLAALRDRSRSAGSTSLP